MQGPGTDGFVRAKKPHMAELKSRDQYCISKTPVSVSVSKGLSPIAWTWGRFLARSTSHSVAAQGGCTKIPLAAGGAQEDETILDGGFLGHGFFRFVPPGSARTDEVLEDLKVRSTVYRQDAFITAPSMTTPAVTYFHSATSSFRAKATMVVFL